MGMGIVEGEEGVEADRDSGELVSVVDLWDLGLEHHICRVESGGGESGYQSLEVMVVEVVEEEEVAGVGGEDASATGSLRKSVTYA